MVLISSIRLINQFSFLHDMRRMLGDGNWDERMGANVERRDDERKGRDDENKAFHQTHTYLTLFSDQLLRGSLRERGGWGARGGATFLAAFTIAATIAPLHFSYFSIFSMAEGFKGMLLCYGVEVNFLRLTLCMTC